MSGPAQACQSSKQTEDEAEEDVAEAEVVVKAEADDVEAEEPDDGVSSSSVVLRSIRPGPAMSNQKP